MKVLLAIIVSVSMFSCVNHDKRSERIVTEFDSVNKKLDSLNSSIPVSASNLYDSVYWKYDDDSISPLQNGVERSLNYLRDLKSRFRIACGDSTGINIPEKSYSEIRITNQFFIHNKVATELYRELSEIQRIFLIHTKDSVLDQDVRRMTDIPNSQRGKDFMTVYFKNVPPVAALTILSKFENDIRTIERKILKEYLNN